MIPDAQDAAVLAAGVIAHVAYFNRGEHDQDAPKYARGVLVSLVSLVLAQRLAGGLSWASSLWQGARAVGLFLAGTYASLLHYRLVFHPLNSFPGPGLGVRVSDLWLSLQLGRGRGDMHRLTLDYYNRYGPYVRVGSSTLMVADPRAVAALHGPDSPCRKGAMYDLEQPNRGIATRDEGLHAARRRVWSRGFGDRALRGYEARVAVYVGLLLDRLDGAAGAPVDAARLMDYFAFDVMGDLGLGQDFGMLGNDRTHEAVGQLVDGLAIMAFRLPMWLLHVLASLPFVPTEETTGFLGFCYGALDRMMATRQQQQQQQAAAGGDEDPGRGAAAARPPSIMEPLLAHFERQQPPERRDMSVIRNDCRFIIVAGSDTVAATLGFVMYYLARDPRQADTLRRELLPLRGAAPAGGPFEHQHVQGASHLNGVINEALRLHPPASTIPRVTPPEGITVGETFIPGDMTVFSSQYVIGRSESNYERAGEFVPERWYSRPEMIKNSVGYAPFSTGPHGCIGRPLALLEMRLLIAECVCRYDISFAPTFDAAGFLGGVQDCMSWHLPDLELCFNPRK